jgi:hypothetical protein
MPYQGTTVTATTEVNTNISEAAQLIRATPARTAGKVIFEVLPIEAING